MECQIKPFYVHWKQFTISGIVSWGYGCGTAGLPPVYTHVFEFVTSGWLKTNGDIWETRYFILNMTSILYVLHFKTRTIFAEIKYRVHVVYFKYYLVQSYWEEVIKNPIIRLWNENRIRSNFRYQISCLIFSKTFITVASLYDKQSRGKYFFVIIIQILDLSLFPLYGLIARNTAYLSKNC